jgi:hypothetical protein
MLAAVLSGTLFAACGKPIEYVFDGVALDEIVRLEYGEATVSDKETIEAVYNNLNVYKLAKQSVSIAPSGKQVGHESIKVVYKEKTMFGSGSEKTITILWTEYESENLVGTVQRSSKMLRQSGGVTYSVGGVSKGIFIKFLP